MATVKQTKLEKKGKVGEERKKGTKGKVTLKDDENSWEGSFVIDKRAVDNGMAAGKECSLTSYFIHF